MSTVYEAVFRVRGRGAYEQATAATDTTIELWCNDHCDLLQASGVESDSVIEEVRTTVGIDDRIDEGREQVLITEDCLKDHMDDNIERFIARHGCLLVPPLKYVGGRKRARVLALDADTLSALYRDLTGEFDVTVETKREIGSITPDSPLLSVDNLLPDLSARQREVFTTAYERGYYELPRGTTTAEIAAEVGVQRRTAEDHLRRAERRLVEAMIEYL